MEGRLSRLWRVRCELTRFRATGSVLPLVGLDKGTGGQAASGTMWGFQNYAASRGAGACICSVSASMALMLRPWLRRR